MTTSPSPMISSGKAGASSSQATRPATATARTVQSAEVTLLDGDGSLMA